VLMQAAAQKVIFADNKEYDAEQVAIDQKHDLAVLRIKADKSFPALKLGRSDDIMIGETVIAIGNPLGYQHTVTAGIVSALNRSLQVEDLTYEGLIQTDASINRGNSGGPLLNVLGELIGINTAIRGDAQNIGFAIPVDALRKLLPDMLSIEHGPKRLEVGLRLSWRNHMYVVEAYGPAAEGGIEAGDEILSIGGMTLKNDVDYYVYLLRIKPEDRLVVEIKRDDKQLQKIIKPQTIPIPDGGKLLLEKFGISVRLLTKTQAEQLDLKAGLIITDVESGSPADQAGFERDLVVVQVGQHFPTTLDEIGLLLEGVHTGEKMMFRVYRIQREFIRVYAVELAAR
jgi:S1-C subfamily serine protease